jgi:hypothetical protein
MGWYRWHDLAARDRRRHQGSLALYFGAPEVLKLLGGCRSPIKLVAAPFFGHDCRHERPTMLRNVTLIALALAASTPVLAQFPLPLPLPLPFPPLPMPQGTPEERAACAPDVQKFCEAALPDTMRVLSCLQANRSRISTACNRVLASHGQ